MQDRDDWKRDDRNAAFRALLFDRDCVARHRQRSAGSAAKPDEEIRHRRRAETRWRDAMARCKGRLMRQDG